MNTKTNFLGLTNEQLEALKSAVGKLILVILAIAGSFITDYFTNTGEAELITALVVPETQEIAADDIAIPADLGSLDFTPTRFTDLQSEDFTATDDITVGDDLTVTGAASVGETLSVAGTTTLDTTIFEHTALTATTVTITPTHTFYSLDSAAAVTITLAASGTEGQLLILVGDDANNVTVADTNLRSHDGAALVLGQYDIAMLVYQDSEWVQIVELATQ